MQKQTKLAIAGFLTLTVVIIGLFLTTRTSSLNPLYSKYTIKRGTITLYSDTLVEVDGPIFFAVDGDSIDIFGGSTPYQYGPVYKGIKEGDTVEVKYLTKGRTLSNCPECYVKKIQ
jgi:hypothetical protein